MTDASTPRGPDPSSTPDHAHSDAARGPDAPPAALVRSPLSDGEWHRLHPLTPVMQGGLFVVIVIGIVIANLRERLVFLLLPWLAPDLNEWQTEWEGEEWSGDPIDWIIVNNLYWLAILAVLGVALILMGVFYLSWRMHTFRITDDDVEVRSGILFRKHRRAPLDRVQGVNLTRPMVARLLGMAKLHVIGAGSDGNVKLEYLSTANAEAIRADILRLASGRKLGGPAAGAGSAAGAGVGARAGAGAGGAPGVAPGAGDAGARASIVASVSRGVTGLIEGDDTDTTEPESVVHIPVGRLIASQLTSGTAVFLVAAIIATIVLLSNGVMWVLFGFVPAVIGIGAYWISQTIKSLRYAISPTPDGVRITFGLFTTVTEIVPPGRIHAVAVTQPLLWRGFGWWTVRINRLSGRSATDTTTDQFTTVLPVGTITDVERVLALILPGMSPDERDIIVDAGARGTGDAGGFTHSPRRAWFIRPFRWRRNAFLLTPNALLMRRGIIWRSVTVLPLARLQSIGISQGPVDRAVRVANIDGHVVLGPVSANLGAIDRDAAVALFEAVARGTVAAVREDRAHRWAEAVGEAEAVSEAAGLDAAGERPSDGDA